MLRKRSLVIGIVCLAGIVLLLQWSVSTSVFRSRRWSHVTECRSHLKVIGLALDQYHNDFGSYPPVWVADERGRPLYSWRVLLLPYLDNPIIYERFRLDEPWDSPHNIQYAKADFKIFRCPACTNEPGTTNYVAVISEAGSWRGPTSLTKEDFTEMLDSTIWVVEQDGLKICWSEPRDLKFDDIPLRVNDPSGIGIGSRHEEGGAVSLSINGKVQFLKNSLTRQRLADILGGAISE